MLLASFVSSIAAGGNFTANDPEIVAAAEAARTASALFWSSRDLPGCWTHPCPIRVRPAPHDGGGTTTFLFDRGEVSGWEMTVSGRRERILVDVLPHEVDHMVRASLVRRPIPRWLDEGCAALMESSDSHQRLRQELRPHDGTIVTARFLDAASYPADGDQVTQLYAVGFSLVEYLLHRRDAATLLAFQQDDRPPSRKLEAYYGVDLPGLVDDWTVWRRRSSGACDCHSLHCPRHAPPTPTPAIMSIPTPSAARETLTIFTSEWCGPCRRFQTDWRQHPSLRRQLEQAFVVRVIDVDRQPLAARQHDIDCVPAFVTSAGVLTGYEGPDWLLGELLPSPAAEPTDLAPRSVPTKSPETLLPPEALPPSPSSAETLPVLPATSPPLLIPRPLTVPESSQPAEIDPRSPTFSLWRYGWSWTWGLATHLWPWLQLAGLVGGSAATGGVATLAIGLLWRLWKHRRAARSGTARTDPVPQGGGAERPAPFPRQLDEARELLELRQSEGRVAILDALRGMFLDDEIQKSLAADDPVATLPLRQLLTNIDARVNEVAPLSVRESVES